MSLAVTPAAAEHLSRQLQTKTDVRGIRLGVKPSGCSGYMYIVDFVSEPTAQDIALDFHGVPVFVDDLSYPMMDAVEVDMVTEGLNRGLRFNNANAISECGCGESFSV
ncbi:iron-sulfur cluster assembly accessory protein [Litorivicinus lipolyticus]|uniref:Iron-sulfur cluster assembly accessory protein n=1 Tax=Litorivicinus lipolyticus TaxID=418701 RepID=A0A5Q2QCH4_9GAMM|nr:iron-sulfur cluster assembly accessory protein [Litorivicinus lipolyticus]QGG79716.1 iron-sulfur cluster assembly accessory protein [Litorivicinus lipolyticus]